LNYTTNYSYQPLVGTAAPLNAAKPLLRHTKKHLQQIVPDNFVVNNGDHFLINGQLNVLNFDWYNATFFGLEGFNGFTPRTIYPSSQFFNGLQTVTNLLLVIDCLQESQIGLAPDFNPYILGKDEVMLGQTTADYLQLQIGDKVVMEFNLGTLTGSQQTKFLETSPLQRTLGLLYSATNQDFPYEISQLASANLGDTFLRTVKLAATYESSVGKFPTAYGNVALLDCHYILDYIFDYAKNDYAKTLPLTERILFIAAINKLQNQLAADGITWCSFAYEIDGVLTN
jgi:hypothetical protein